MTDDSLKYGTLARALTPNDDDARQLQRVALVNADQHRPDLNEFPRQVH